MTVQPLIIMLWFDFKMDSFFLLTISLFNNVFLDNNVTAITKSFCIVKVTIGIVESCRLVAVGIGL